jgi:hypothetical protein
VGAPASTIHPAFCIVNATLPLLAASIVFKTTVEQEIAKRYLRSMRNSQVIKILKEEFLKRRFLREAFLREAPACSSVMI